MKAQLLHFDATDRQRWMVRFPSRDMRANRPDEKKNRDEPTGDVIAIDSRKPLFAMLFNEHANPAAIIAGDFKSNRVIASGWPEEGRRTAVHGRLLDLASTKRGISHSFLMPSLHQEPRAIPSHRYVALRQGSRCVVLFQSGTSGYAVNDWSVALTPEEMGMVLDGLKSGMKDVWKEQHEPDCRFQLEPLAAFYEAP